MMKPAELKMELLILLCLPPSSFFFFSGLFSLSFSPYCSLFLFLWHNISEPPPCLSGPCPLSSVCCGCCAVAPTKIEIKKYIYINWTFRSWESRNTINSWNGSLLIFPDKKPWHGERKKKMKKKQKKPTTNPPWYDDVIFHSITNWGNQFKIFFQC